MRLSPCSGGVFSAHQGLHRDVAHGVDIDGAAEAGRHVAHADPPVVVLVQQRHHAGRADGDGLQAFRVQHEEALAELSAARVAVQQEAAAVDAVLGDGLVHHRQQHVVVADVVELDALVCGQGAGFDDAHREQRCQHDAVVALGEIGKAVAVLGGRAAGAMDDHGQVIRLGRGLVIVRRHKLSFTPWPWRRGGCVDMDGVS
ncbi:hypothetical protein G6F22_018144 [Rhizopus arrhizus]|nr:hypothetical protein G6F22_018144 [Rhizopus arrhizus]